MKITPHHTALSCAPPPSHPLQVRAGGRIGTWSYWAPEMMRQQPYNRVVKVAFLARAYRATTVSSGCVRTRAAAIRTREEGAGSSDRRRKRRLFSHTPPKLTFSPRLTTQSRYNHAVDMWALGVFLYILLVGFHPFDPDGEASEQQALAGWSKCVLARPWLATTGSSVSI